LRYIRCVHLLQRLMLELLCWDSLKLWLSYVTVVLDLQKEIERREEQLEAMYSDPELMKVQYSVLILPSKS
jgi:hypothetical protein